MLYQELIRDKSVQPRIPTVNDILQKWHSKTSRMGMAWYLCVVPIARWLLVATPTMLLVYFKGCLVTSELLVFVMEWSCMIDVDQQVFGWCLIYGMGWDGVGWGGMLF